jgi:uracil-DNA glycosylase
MTAEYSSDLKRRKLRRLAQQRRAAGWVGYNNIGCYHAGAYDCDHVSPYTKSAGNVDAEVFVLLQDWASDAWLSGPLSREVRDLGYAPQLQTNVNLKRLLRDSFGLELAQVYLTNLFPFVKLGGMQARIPSGDLMCAARTFAWPQIEIVRPKLVVCLGVETFNALRTTRALATRRPFPVALDSSFDNMFSRIWCQVHPGSRGTRARGAEQMQSDWKRMKEDFDALGS